MCRGGEEEEGGVELIFLILSIVVAFVSFGCVILVMRVVRILRSAPLCASAPLRRHVQKWANEKNDFWSTTQLLGLVAV